MRYAPVPIVVFLVLCGGLLSCDLMGSSHGETYPATLRALSDDQRQNRVEAYRQESDHQICSQLNEFGLTIGDGCFSPEHVPDDTLSREGAIAMAKRTLSRHSRYTNVSSDSQLRVDDASTMRNAGKPEGAEWRVWFKDQRRNGKRVHNTQIFVWLTSEGVYRIGGHWYQDVVFPDDPVSAEKALQASLGYRIPYSDWTGADTLTVSEDNLPSRKEVEMSVLPVEKNTKIELRVVWAFPVQESFFRVYVDAAEGKVLDHEQLVVF